MGTPPSAGAAESFRRQRPLVAVAAVLSILLSPILFAFEVMAAVLLAGFGIAFRNVRPSVGERLAWLGVGVAAGPIAYVMLAVVVALTT